jgi:predicted transcriptional regulator
MIEPKDIARIRKMLDLTQSGLAKLSGVSQSLIAKIESNVLDPSYSNMKKINDALDNHNVSQQKTAKDLMTKKIIFVKPKDDIRRVAEVLKKNNISQVLVIGKDVVGLVTESGIIESLLDKEMKLAEDIMSSPPPVIDINTPESVIIDLLKFYQIIVVKQKSDISGVITKSNLLEMASGR